MPKKEVRTPKIEAAFFDVDNTLVCGSTTIIFGKAAFSGGAIRRRDIWRFAYEQIMFIRRGEKNSKMADFKDRALSITKGHPIAELMGIMPEVYANEIKPRLWPGTVKAVKEHLALGHEVWLITAAPQELAQQIANDLGATGALGTIVGHKDGVLTGELVGDPLHGQAKRKAARKLAKDRNISLKRSYAYSDSVNDLPLLTLVGNPIVVNPDKPLKRYADAAGWDILRFKRKELRK